MFKNLIPLDREAHANLRYLPNQPYHFAAKESVIPLVIGEIKQVARFYPVLFTKGEVVNPVALVGLKHGQNLHVKESGHWIGQYIPAHIRRFPFMLGQQTPGENEQPDQQRFVILMDQNAPHLSYEAGERLFTPDGRFSPTLEKIKNVLINLQKQMEATIRLTKELQNAGLLVERDLTIALPKHDKYAISGFRVIDTQALTSCTPDQIAGFMQNGALMLIFAHIFSLTNLEDGWLTMQAAETKKDVDDMFGKDDMIRFDF